MKYNFVQFTKVNQRSPKHDLSVYGVPERRATIGQFTRHFLEDICIPSKPKSLDLFYSKSENAIGIAFYSDDSGGYKISKSKAVSMTYFFRSLGIQYDASIVRFRLERIEYDDSIMYVMSKII